MSPCSPLINSDDLIKASKVLDKYPNKIILPITEYSAPIQWAFEIKKKNYLKPLKKGYYKIRSQKLKKYYHNIDDLEDWKYAELLFSRLKRK